MPTLVKTGAAPEDHREVFHPDPERTVSAKIHFNETEMLKNFEGPYLLKGGWFQ